MEKKKNTFAKKDDLRAKSSKSTAHGSQSLKKMSDRDDRKPAGRKSSSRSTLIDNDEE